MLGGKLGELDVPQGGLEIGPSPVFIEALRVLRDRASQGVDPPLQPLPEGNLTRIESPRAVLDEVGERL